MTVPFNTSHVFFCSTPQIYNTRMHISMQIGLYCITKYLNYSDHHSSCISHLKLNSEVDALVYFRKAVKPWAHSVSFADNPVMCTNRPFLSWGISLTTVPSQTISTHCPLHSTTFCPIYLHQAHVGVFLPIYISHACSL